MMSQTEETESAKTPATPEVTPAEVRAALRESESRGVLPRHALPTVAMIAVGVAGFVKLLLGTGWVLAVVAGWLVLVVGYAGWSRGQLEGEICQKAWLVLPPARELIEMDEPETAWRRIMRSSGPLM